MGAWDAKPLGNDTALDWLWTLEKAKDDSVLNATLSALLNAKAEPEAPLCEEAVAAAAVIEAARREPMGKLPAEVKQWISERGFVPPDSLVQLAIKALKRIATQSELRALWEEARSVAKWEKEIDSLLTGLRKSLELPPPTRKPKPPSARLSLPKLIEKVNPDEDSPLREKLRRKLEAIGDVNAPLDYVDPPLNLVAARGLISEAKRLIDRGAHVNPKLENPIVGRTPLEAACARGRATMAALLLEHGAQVYRQTLRDELGCILTPVGSAKGASVFRFPQALWCAVRSGDVETVEVLVRHGANLESRDLDGTTLLHAAVESADYKLVAGMIQFLVQHGADLEAEGRNGETPFYRAAVTWNKSAMEQLLALGANPNAKNSEGDTALDFVDRPGPAQEIATFLRQHGAKKGSEV